MLGFRRFSAKEVTAMRKLIKYFAIWKIFKRMRRR